MTAAGAGRNPFGHVDLRVPSIAAALPFYEALLPALGFTRRYDGGDWRIFATELPPPAALIGHSRAAAIRGLQDRLHHPPSVRPPP